MDKMDQRPFAELFDILSSFDFDSTNQIVRTQWETDGIIKENLPPGIMGIPVAISSLSVEN